MNHVNIASEVKYLIQFSLRTRRANQLRVNAEYQRTSAPPRPRKARLRFSEEIELLDATSRNDIHEGMYREIERRVVL